MSSSEVLTALGQYENRAKNLLNRLGQLADHLRQVQSNPQQIPPDWPTIVTHFRVTESQLSQLQKDVQSFLQYFVFRPVSKPPPQADVPLMLSTRSHVDMESYESQLQAKFWDQLQQGPEEDVLELISTTNEAIERICTICDWRLTEFKDVIRNYCSPHLEAKWRDGAGKKAHEVFTWLEGIIDGRIIPPQSR